MNGTVKFFNNAKGFGFIAGEDGKDYFVHLSGLQDGVAVKDNDAVTFDTEQGERGPKAVNVALADGAAVEETPAAVSIPPDEEEDAAEEETDEGSDDANEGSDDTDEGSDDTDEKKDE